MSYHYFGTVLEFGGQVPPIAKGSVTAVCRPPDRLITHRPRCGTVLLRTDHDEIVASDDMRVSFYVRRKHKVGGTDGKIWW